MSISMLLRPCEVCRITSGSTPISWPTLSVGQQGGPGLGVVARAGTEQTYVCQCLTTALVESMMVPSMSNRAASKETLFGGAEKLIVS